MERHSHSHSEFGGGEEEQEHEEEEEEEEGVLNHKDKAALQQEKEKQHRSVRWSIHETKVLVLAKKRESEELSRRRELDDLSAKRQQQQQQEEALGGLGLHAVAAYPDIRIQSPLHQFVSKKQKQQLLLLPSQERLRLSADEKWAAISEYCKANGCDRSDAQCRKRWSQLVTDYKKIKDYQILKAASETYWLMKSDRKKRLKLPPLFDIDVYRSMEWFGRKSGAKQLADQKNRIYSQSPSLEDLVFSDPEVAVTPRAMRPSSPPSGDEMFAALECSNGEDAAHDEPPVVKSRKRRLSTQFPEEILLSVLEKNTKAFTDVLKENSLRDRSLREEQGAAMVHVLGEIARAFGEIAKNMRP